MTTTDTYADIEEQYRPSIIKRYQWWTLLLHQDQRYLGRSIMWLKRPGRMQRFSRLSLSELHELMTGINEHEHATRTLWQDDHVNDAALGNNFSEHGGHFHLHLIPRYATARTFAGVVFTDQRWWQNGDSYEPLNCFPYETFKPTQETFWSIRDALREEIRGSVR